LSQKNDFSHYQKDVFDLLEKSSKHSASPIIRSMHSQNDNSSDNEMSQYAFDAKT
jgi:hypothetical protein